MRLRVKVAAIGLLIAAPNVVHGQEVETGAVPETEFFAVIGIADNDLLNLRATASPGGMLIARVPNGTLLRNHGCAEVSGNGWCKVSNADDPKEMGWAAQRYLQPTGTEGSAEFYTDDAAPDAEISPEPAQ